MLNLSTIQLIDPSPLPQTPASPDTLANILTIVFTVIGALAFLMLVITGLRYITAQEPAKIAEVRRQMAYIAIGLIVAVSADAIVNFVLKKAG